MAAIDCGGVTDALAVEGELSLRNMLLRGAALRSTARPNMRAQFRLDQCPLWPSFVIMPGARVRPSARLRCFRRD